MNENLPWGAMRLYRTMMESKDVELFLYGCAELFELTIKLEMWDEAKTVARKTIQGMKKIDLNTLSEDRQEKIRELLERYDCG